MSDALLTPDILNDIKDNSIFSEIFITSASDKDFMETFNKIANTNVNFNSQPKDPISYLVDDATGFDGVLAKPEDMEKLVYLVYKFIYIQLKKDPKNFGTSQE